MKKSLLVASMALCAVAANAQYTSNPELKTITDKGAISSMEWLILDATSLQTVIDSKAKVTAWAPDQTGRFLYIWPDGSSLIAGDASYPGVGMHFDGYLSLNVGTLGWSGAGYFMDAKAKESTMMWNDQTRFHLAYMSNGPAPASIGLILAQQEGDGAGVAAKIAVGDPFVDNGVIYPAVGPKSKDDWQGIDISFADLKRICPTFSYKAVTGWGGNIFAFLAGGVTGQNVSFDACYFYNMSDAGVDNVVADQRNWIVGDKTINLNGGTGIELIDLTGKTVKATEGATLGLTDLTPGIYVARSGNSTTKVVVK